MKYNLLMIAILFIGCANKENAKPTPIAVATEWWSKFDTISTNDSIRREFAYELGNALTQKYGYDIYAEAVLSNVDAPGNVKPILNLYCNWFDDRNVTMVYTEIPDSLYKSLGFVIVHFMSNRERYSDYNSYLIKQIRLK